MWEAQGVALVITSTTALLAVFAPFALRWWEERDRRQRENKAQIEQHLFFVLDNYIEQRHSLELLVETLAWKTKQAITDGRSDTEKKPQALVAGFHAKLVKLRMLKGLYSIDDDGFCEAVLEYIGRPTSIPMAPAGDPGRFGRESEAVYDYLVDKIKRKNPPHSESSQWVAHFLAVPSV